MKPISKVARRKEWFDNDSFWRELYSFLFSEERFTAAAGQVAQALALTKPPGKTALDLCCGPGRCSVALAKRGFRVTGVDRTRFLLNKARAKARAAHVKIEWVREDMRDFIRPNSFALALSMFTSFGYFEDRQEDLAVLRNVFRSLQPGGVLLIELLGKERLAKVFQSTSSTFLPDGNLLVERREVFDDWTRIRNEWLLIQGHRVKRFRFQNNVYSGLELRNCLELAGFTAVRLYGSLAGEPYGPNAERLVAVARKPRLST